jgi:CrcB protein
MIKTLALIALGGAIGSAARHGMNMLALRFAGPDFPWGTIAVNIIGSLAIGIIAGTLAQLTNWSQELRLFLVVGVLGGFTTFSAFSLDSVLLWERGAYLQMALYIGGSVLISIAGTFGGLAIVRILSP